MPNEDGFDLLDSIKDKNFSVIFITAHNQYALKAIKAGAIDYLEKPIDVEDLQKAVAKIAGSSAKVGNIDNRFVQYWINIKTNRKWIQLQYQH